jgi:hypothetical protein
MMGRRLPVTGALIEQALPFLKPRQGVKLLMWMHAFVTGLAPLAEPAPVLKEVYRKESDLSWMLLDFGESYFDVLNTILDGWQQQNATKPKRRK